MNRKLSIIFAELLEISFHKMNWDRIKLNKRQYFKHLRFSTVILLATESPNELVYVLHETKSKTSRYSFFFKFET